MRFSRFAGFCYGCTARRVARFTSSVIALGVAARFCAVRGMWIAFVSRLLFQLVFKRLEVRVGCVKWNDDACLRGLVMCARCSLDELRPLPAFALMSAASLVSTCNAVFMHFATAGVLLSTVRLIRW